MELARQPPGSCAESLWERLSSATHKRPVALCRLPRAVLMASAARLRIVRAPYGAGWQIGEHELRSPSLDFRSDDAAEIRAWVKAKTNIDIEMPAGSAVRLLGPVDPVEGNSSRAALPRGR